MSYDPEPGYDYDAQRDPESLPPAEFDGLAWPAVRELTMDAEEYVFFLNDRHAEEEFLMNVWAAQWYEENPSEWDY